LIRDIIDNYTTKGIEVLSSINSIDIYSNSVIEDSEGFNDATDEYHSCDIICATDEYNTIFITSN
jgi:hypothetical protein